MITSESVRGMEKGGLHGLDFVQIAKISPWLRDLHGEYEYYQCHFSIINRKNAEVNIGNTYFGVDHRENEVVVGDAELCPHVRRLHILLILRGDTNNMNMFDIIMMDEGSPLSKGRLNGGNFYKLNDEHVMECVGGPSNTSAVVDCATRKQLAKITYENLSATLVIRYVPEENLSHMNKAIILALAFQVCQTKYKARTLRVPIVSTPLYPALKRLSKVEDCSIIKVSSDSGDKQTRYDYFHLTDHSQDTPLLEFEISSGISQPFILSVTDIAANQSFILAEPFAEKGVTTQIYTRSPVNKLCKLGSIYKKEIYSAGCGIFYAMLIASSSESDPARQSLTIIRKETGFALAVMSMHYAAEGNKLSLRIHPGTEDLTRALILVQAMKEIVMRYKTHYESVWLGESAQEISKNASGRRNKEHASSQGRRTGIAATGPNAIPQSSVQNKGQPLLGGQSQSAPGPVPNKGLPAVGAKPPTTSVPTHFPVTLQQQPSAYPSPAQQMPYATPGALTPVPNQRHPPVEAKLRSTSVPSHISGIFQPRPSFYPNPTPAPAPVPNQGQPVLGPNAPTTSLPS